VSAKRGEEKVPKIAFSGVVAVATVLAGLSGGGAGAAELKVTAALVMQSALQELAPGFEKASGHKLKIEYDTAGKINDKVTADAEIDVAILTKPLADKLIAKAKLVGGTSATLFRTPLVLVVKQGAAKPDIGSVDAFKKALSGAKSIAYTDPATGGASGVVVTQMLDKLGIAAELKPKTKLSTPNPGNRAPDLVAKGDAEIAIAQLSLVMGVAGIDIVGPLPAELQSPDLTFIAASPMASEQPVPAKAFIDFLTKPEAKTVFKAKGMEPG
jgi:molybdate transport system substrate-binding protein